MKVSAESFRKFPPKDIINFLKLSISFKYTRVVYNFHRKERLTNAICATCHCLASSFAPLLSSLGPAFLFIMGKEKSVFWAYFTVRGRNRHGEPNWVSCSPGHCQWEQGANATRMKKHLVEAHLPQAQATDAASLVPVVPVVPVVSTDGAVQEASPSSTSTSGAICCQETTHGRIA